MGEIARPIQYVVREVTQSNEKAEVCEIGSPSTKTKLKKKVIYMKPALPNTKYVIFLAFFPSRLQVFLRGLVAGPSQLVARANFICSDSSDMLILLIY